MPAIVELSVMCNPRFARKALSCSPVLVQRATRNIFHVRVSRRKMVTIERFSDLTRFSCFDVISVVF